MTLLTQPPLIVPIENVEYEIDEKSNTVTIWSHDVEIMNEIDVEDLEYNKYFYDLAATYEDAKEIAQHLVGFEIKRIKRQIWHKQNEIQELNEVINDLQRTVQAFKNKPSDV